MGAWGTKVWENDDAADWFMNFGKSINIDMIEETVNNFNINDGVSIEENRAVAYVLSYIGRVYVWPNTDFDTRDAILDKTVENLYSIFKDDEYIESWIQEEDRVKVKESLEMQIESLLEIGPMKMREKYAQIHVNQTMTME